jgi:creatinine amidohydrolase
MTRWRWLAALMAMMAGAALSAQEPAAGPAPIIAFETQTSASLAALDAARTLVIMTVAPHEQHGPHLPVNTDPLISEWLARACAERFAATRPAWTVLMVPAFTWSAAAVSSDFPGNTPTSSQAVRDGVLGTLGEFARAGFRHFLVVDNHLQADAQTAISQAVAQARFNWGIRVVQPLASIIFDEDFRTGVAALVRDDPSALAILDADVHAGFIETSAMLAIAPQLVDRDAVAGLPPVPMGSQEFGFRTARGATIREIGAERGYVGAPAAADAGFGRNFLDLLTGELAAVADRLADDADQALFSERRNFFDTIPMQGPIWAFAFPVADATAYDGFSPGLLACGVAGGNVGFTALAAWGTDSGQLVGGGELTLGHFFLDPLEVALRAGSQGGIRMIGGEARWYFGVVEPGLQKRPPLRLAAGYRWQEAVALPAEPVFAGAGPMPSLEFRVEYDPGFGEPFAFSGTGLADHHPVLAAVAWEIAPAALGGGRDWDQLTGRFDWYSPLVPGCLEVAGHSFAAFSDVLFPDGSLPGQKLVNGAASQVFRGFPSWRRNLFAQVVSQSLELRSTFVLPANPVLAAVGVNLFADAGFGAADRSRLLAGESFRLDAGLALVVSPAFLPLSFRCDFGFPLAGFADWPGMSFGFGIGQAF